mmetsp:Transcript_13197/g.26787  ORF Transcript_13197/g.26787 Transcript_13197/m.26787 type:complete len:236 (-) Transcript_13197:446-1153(-)
MRQNPWPMRTIENKGSRRNLRPRGRAESRRLTEKTPRSTRKLRRRCAKLQRSPKEKPPMLSTMIDSKQSLRGKTLRLMRRLSGTSSYTRHNQVPHGLAMMIQTMILWGTMPLPCILAGAMAVKVIAMTTILVRLPPLVLKQIKKLLRCVPRHGLLIQFARHNQKLARDCTSTSRSYLNPLGDELSPCEKCWHPRRDLVDGLGSSRERLLRQAVHPSPRNELTLSRRSHHPQGCWR